MRWVRRWIGVALIAAFMVGGWTLKAENSDSVDVDFLFGEIHVELWEALLAAFAAGFALAGAGWLWAGLRSGMTIRRYRKEVSGLEAEVHQLRNLPLVTASGQTDARGGGEPARARRFGG
ncbi:MAG TPA: lipopolysaccharide assembly protein LapA domain-containing protein [Myxococcota bacterium]|nr:lipopolysaccharide assembly protein LapA domain-containing protein [Myxococcota bacterium]